MNKEMTIKFDTVYESFPDFIISTKDPLYKEIIKAFKKLEKSESITLNVQANVDERIFNTLLEYDKLGANILIDVILPFYVECEEYEVCADIMKVYNSLTIN